ncbi:stealth family protein [[Enterobacter] lignolyticus]|uniref:stealth family protein n=1 Tax=[Enterobacter] lignolyticus TaxID=1334193 RepID=UPI0009007332|nr:stealth family protein [[Enterobacter] lignolyticus]
MDAYVLRSKPTLFRKVRKLVRSPGAFFRDYLNKKYPEVYNEIKCPREEEAILLRHDLALESQIIVDDPIDVVFTWVDDHDEIWQKKYLKYKNNNVKSHGQYASDSARFSNHNELYYAIKGVVENLPWVRFIYVVTDGQKPEWIMEYPNVIIVDHAEIIPSEYLPTFNSHVIEAHLHRIPGLAEHFIYLNDDVFVARPLPAGHFFKGKGVTSLFISRKSLHEMQGRSIQTPTLNASVKVRELFNRDYGVVIDTPLVHTYVPLRKSMFEAVWCKYRYEVLSFLPNKFRTNSDLNLATFMVPWYTFMNGSAVPARDICYYFNIRSPMAKTHYRLLQSAKYTDGCPHSFCANDFTSTQKSIEGYQQSLITMLNRYFDTGGVEINN